MSDTPSPRPRHRPAARSGGWILPALFWTGLIVLGTVAASAWLNSTRGSRALEVRDGDTLVPNELMVAQAVQNHNERGTVRVAVRVQASYAAEPEAVLALLLECAQGIPRVVTDPAPAAFMVLFADNGIEYELGVWINDPHNGKLGVQSDLNRAIYRRFKQAGIDIPYPQREVRVLGSAASPLVAKSDSDASSASPSTPA